MFLLDWFYGILASLGLWQKEAKILFLGLDNAGKSTLLDVLRDERLVQHQPTQYPPSEEFSIGKIKFKAFDLGGHQIVRRVLNDYCAKVDAVVYLVDASNWRESQRELRALLSDESLVKVPFLILGNETDLHQATEVFRSELAKIELITGNGMNFFDRVHLESLETRLERRQGLIRFTTWELWELGKKIGRPYSASECALQLYMGLARFTTGRGTVNLTDLNVRPLEVFSFSIERRMGYGEGFKWLSQYIK